MDEEESMIDMGEIIRLASAKDYPSNRLIPIETRIANGPDFHDATDLIAAAIGEEIPQGSFFTYLFRRFGYPNIGSDDYKELCRYVLTTEHPEMLMGISPYAGGNSSISISFLLDPKIVHECREYPYAARNKHNTNFIKWIEDNDRVPDFVNDILDEVKAAGWHSLSDHGEWTAIIPPITFSIHEFEKKKDGSKAPKPVAWYLETKQEYDSLHPTPEIQWRNADWMKWDDEDPMKPIAAAIFETLEDLKRPVAIRDISIDPWGVHDETIESNGADYTAVAGYPSGALINVDPAGFAELHNLIARSCPEDHAEAIKIACKVMQDHLDKAQTESPK